MVTIPQSSTRLAELATIHEVAKRAGVAPITVSRVINKSGYFSEDVRARVQAAIGELGYVPNSLARSLRSKRTNTLALVVTDITNPFFTMIARGVEDEASEAGFTVIFCNTDESEDKEKKYLDMLLQKQVDGILLVPARSTSQPVKLTGSQNTPVVVLDRRIPGIAADVVRCDSESGAYQLTRILLELGHRRIGMLTGPRQVSTAVDRVAGYQKAMRDAGLNDIADLILFGEYNEDDGFRMARQMLSLDPRPTGLVAANNFIAIGAIKAVRELGLRIPEDVALVAFDDLPQALVISPFITVVAQPGYDMGRKAVQLLLDRLSGKVEGGFQEVIFPTQVVLRKSSGEPVANSLSR